jgi:hypothetical protein
VISKLSPDDGAGVADVKICRYFSAMFCELAENDLVEEISGNYSLKGIQLDSIEIPSQILAFRKECAHLQISNLPIY